MSPTRKSKRKIQHNRRGTATIEFAIVAPIFVLMLLGLWQASSLYQVQNELSIIVREGARIATLERSEAVPAGMTTNQKVMQDLETLLQVHGYDAEQATITISEVDDTSQEFDLDDPTNDMGYFRVTIEYPCLDRLRVQPQLLSEYNLSASIVFRNGFAQVVE